MRYFRTALIAAALVAAQAPAQAQDYPTRPITLVLPLGAGGAMDIIARAQFEPKLRERLGKPIVIENRTGGGTVIAATSVAKSTPDGYTLFFVPAGTLTTNATLYKKLPYDPAKDFVPIALTSKIGFVLSVNPSLPVHSVAELIALREGAATAALVRLHRHRRDPASRRRDADARRRLRDERTCPIAACRRR